MPRCSFALLAAVAAAALVACACPSLALYEEEAGTFDWHLQQVGQPAAVAFSEPPSQGKPSKTAYVATHQGVLAALRTKSGALAWRQVLPEGERVSALAARTAARTALLATASPRCQAVRVWKASTGALVWESVAANGNANGGDDLGHLSSALRQAAQAKTSPAQDAADACFAAFVEGGKRLLTASAATGKVTLRDAQTGNERWTASVGDAGAAAVLPLVGDASLVGVVAADGRLVLLGLADGRTAAEWPVPAGAAATWSGQLVSLSEDGRQLTVTDASSATADAAPASAGHPLSGVKGLALGGQSPVAGSVRALTPPGACEGGRAAFVELRGPAGGLAQAVAVGAGGKAPEARGQAAAAVGGHCGGDTAAAAAQDAQDASRGAPAAVFAAGAGRALVVRADQSVAGQAASGKRLWVREEALASVVASRFLEAPPKSPFVEGEGEDDEPEFPPVWRRLGVQARMLAAMARRTVAAGLVAARRLAGDAEAAMPADADYEELFGAASDPFGFHKRVLAVTGPGRLYALSTLDGAPEWSFQLRDTDGTPLCDLFQGGSRWRFELRVTGLLHAVVVATPAGGPAGVVRAWNVNTRTGQAGPAADVSLGSNLAAVQRLPLLDSAHHSPVVLLAGSLEEARVFPDTAEARALVRANAGRVFFHVADPATGTVRGARLVAAAGGGVAASATWTLAFPPSVERVSAVASARDEAVQSAVRRVGGGTEAVHKWLNPHLLVVATVRGAAGLHPVPSVKQVTDPSVSVYLVDGVTGAVVERFSHRHGQGPVEAVVSENAVYYQFFDTKSNRFELSSVELTHDASRGDPSLLAGTEFSSFDSAAPASVQRTFHLEGAASATALAVTTTRRGIADKSLLLGLGRGQVALLPRRMVDARRPHTTEPSAADKADGLVPYRAVLPIPPQQVVSYSRHVARVRAIDTHHALLESTSLVFARGLDLFFTRVTPSAGFDLLSEDFNAPFLLVTVFGVVAATVFARGLAARKRLQLAWA